MDLTLSPPNSHCEALTPMVTILGGRAVTKMRVRLPIALKANIREAGADVKESGLFAGVGHLDDERLMSQSLSPPFIGGRGFFYEEGEGNRTERSRERFAKFSTCR